MRWEQGSELEFKSQINVASTVFGRGTEVRREISKARLRRVTCAVEASDVAFTTVPGCTF